MKRTAGPQLAALVPVDRDSGVALHRQIYDGFRRAVAG